MSGEPDVISSRIWAEVPEPDNPFAAAACYCAGFDVYGELLGKAGWIEYLYLLIKQEQPTRAQAQLLEGLAVALANPGVRDHSVRAAMNAGVGGSTAASCLMAALAVGAGQLGGAREVSLAINGWQLCGTDLATWGRHLVSLPEEERVDVWTPMEHPPGFDPNGVSCPRPVRQTLAHLGRCGVGSNCYWLDAHRSELEALAGCPLAMTGVAAAAMSDLGLEAGQGEMLYLLLRLPGAAVHALEQREFGWRRYPFFRDGIVLEEDPRGGAP
jgi:citrate synthase